jgi:hypothetical protein
VFAIVKHVLLFPSRMLLLPAQMMTFLGAAGMPPCIILHSTCWILSPPIPALVHVGSFAWERARKRGRDKRSTKESPMMQLVGDSLKPSKQCFSNLSPHDSALFDRLVCANRRGAGL